MRAVFSWTRYIIFFGVIGLLLAALAVFVFGLIATGSVILEVFGSGEFNAEGARVLSIELIEMVDLFLLGTILFITSIGLQELFIDPTMAEVLPEWLSVSSVDELKFNLLAVVIVMLAVLFLGVIAGLDVEAEGGFDILDVGLAVAAVVLAEGVAVYLFARVHHMRGEHEEHPSEAVLVTTDSVEHEVH